MRKSLDVNSVTVEDLLSLLGSGEWLIPRFQRDFVWSVADVAQLIYSILELRPIGMATLWEQPDRSGLDLEPVSIPDSGAPRYFRPVSEAPNRTYAVLDGRQRCTAIAMAF